MNTQARRSPLRWLARAVIALVVLALLLVGVLLMIEWRPPPLQETPIAGGADGAPAAGATLSLISWNVGYAGLGKQADFFMDGGDQVSPPSAAVVRENLSGILAYLAQQDADVMLLQEVDLDASRTFHIDQVAAFTSARPDFFHARAANFKVPFVPVPLRSPIGKVNSGLLALSAHPLEKAVRHQLPGNYGWPVRVFHLKRCLHELRFPAPDGKDWVILHLHLSAFDTGGTLRKQQMTYLRALLLQLEQEGHHVVVGGDWNQAFPGLDVDSFAHQAERPEWFQLAPPDWTPPGWSWAYDPKTPSLRANNKPYVPGRNFVTTVDGFLLSPELEQHEVRCDDLGFEHSDHQPVYLRLSIRGAAQAEPAQAAPEPAK